MNPPTLTPEQLEDRAAVGFLERLFVDRAAGLERSLADYLVGQGPFAARIAHEWLLATGRLQAAAPATGAPAGGASRQDHLGPYHLLAELGRGGQGIVYLAEDTRLGRRVALKVLARDLDTLAGPAQLRLQREADTLARLDHPGINTIYETGATDGTAWIAMRHIPGGSIQQAIAARVAQGLGPPTTPGDREAAVRLVERAARALEAAHRAGILHRDVKPANLLLAAPEQPVLVDFGLASDRDSRTPTITLPGAVFGTLSYLPPERLAGAAADVRADVYGLGAVLFELLTLQRPYQAATLAAELQAIQAGPLPDVRHRNPAVPRDLAIVVATALARSPAERYQTASSFADDLARVLDREPILARPAGPGLRLLRWTQRNPGLAASLFALAAVLTLGLAAVTWQWQRAAAALADVHRLADLKLARELHARAAALWPARPEQIAGLQQWQRELAALQERAPLHQRRLADLPAAGHDPTTDWQRQQLEELQREHQALTAVADDVARRVATAGLLVPRTIDAPRAAWAAASARIAADPRYGGLQLRPQPGLVPLGPDPHSGLEEFAHWSSGELPPRDAAGELQLTADAAIVLVLVPGGTAVLGAEAKAPTDGRAANVDASAPAEFGPCYTVALEPFFFGKFELTQEQWQRHTGKNPSAYRRDGDLTTIQQPRHPVELVSWAQADRTLRELDLQLPTEAQWEWAYRAGTRTRYPSGDDERSLDGRENLADATAAAHRTPSPWRCIDWLDDGHLVHAPVGSFLPNGFGLHDLGGNVKEWCRDTWEDLPACAPRPGDGLRDGPHERLRIVRGGCFSSHLDEPRAAHRGGTDLDTAGAEAGLRPARAIER